MNDAREEDKACNARMKKILANGKVCLALFASQFIHKGDEVRYDYGEEDAHWRKVYNFLSFFYYLSAGLCFKLELNRCIMSIIACLFISRNFLL